LEKVWRLRVQSGLLNHFEKDSATIRSYEGWKKDVVNQISEAFKNGKKDSLRKSEIVASMKDVIQKQVNEGKYNSNHLSNSARDIRTKNITQWE